jgi:acetyl esterase/lipase
MSRMKAFTKSMLLLATVPALSLAQGTPVTVKYVANGTVDQTMDVYWPASRATATVLFIHGGSLQESGERRTSPLYRNVCTQFVARGIACASMDYRLAPNSAWPTMPQDVASAVVSLRKLLANGKGDPEKVFLFGHSSGCHLAAIIGMDSTYLHAVDLRTRNIAGIIAMGCTLDRDDATLRGLTAEKIRTAFMNDPQEVATYKSAENYLSANPASHIGKHVPPLLVVVAESERFMPPIMEQGARVVRRLLEEGVAANLVVVPGTHMSSIQAVGKSDDPTLAAILRFIADPRGSGAAH